MTELTPDQRAVLSATDWVWRTGREIGVFSTKRRTAILRALERRGFVGYRAPDGTAGVLAAGEWAITEAGDAALRDVDAEDLYGPDNTAGGHEHWDPS